MPWDYTTPIEEVMRALDDLVAAGKVNAVALSDAPAWVASAANTQAGLRGWSPLVALQAEYSLLERTAERELLPAAAAFGLSVCAWAPMGAGILTGKYTRGPSTTPTDSRRAAANQARLTDRNLHIAREVELPVEHRARLDEVSQIELGFPYELLRGPQGQMVYGDLEPQIDLPPTAPYRWR